MNVEHIRPQARPPPAGYCKTGVQRQAKHLQHVGKAVLRTESESSQRL